jgi:hypothetical protein
MGLGVAKIQEDTVTHISRHEPADAAYGLSDTLLIGRDHFSQIFRIHASRQRRGAYEVTEHHRDLASLRSVTGSAVGCRQYLQRCLDRGGVDPEVGNGIQQLTSVPYNSDAKILQVLDRQAGEDCVVDEVFSERRLILTEVKAP